MSYQSGEAPLLDEEEEGTSQFNGHTRVRAEAARKEEELRQARGSVQKLKDGLASWITANKQRSDTLGMTVDRCDTIVWHTVEQSSLLTEAQHAQTKNLAAVSAVSSKVEEQDKLLKDFGKLVTQIGDRTDEMASWSLFGPPQCLLTFLCGVFSVAAVLTITAYVLEYGIGVDYIRES